MYKRASQSKFCQREKSTKFSLKMSKKISHTKSTKVHNTFREWVCAKYCHELKGRSPVSHITLCDATSKSGQLLSKDVPNRERVGVHGGMARERVVEAIECHSTPQATKGISM